MFKSMDTNADGMVDLDEFTVSLPVRETWGATLPLLCNPA